METNWAAENLRTIRTLMERSAIYRRALAPVMSFVGALAMGAVFVGRLVCPQSRHSFIYYWVGVCIVAVTGVLLLIRRQALKSSEPFWTPPTRRVVEAMAPALVLGALTTAFFYFFLPGGELVSAWMLPPIWIGLYGCALHAGGFFMPRGVRLLGWCFLVCSASLLLIRVVPSLQPALPLFDDGYLAMGISFGCLHLAYGIYLYFTEKRGNES